MADEQVISFRVTPEGHVEATIPNDVPIQALTMAALICNRVAMALLDASVDEQRRKDKPVIERVASVPDNLRSLPK